MNIQFILYALVAAFSFAGAWGIQGNRHEAILAERTAAHATALADATSKALADSQALAANVEAVQKTAEARRRAIAADRDRAVSELVGLRHAAADTAARACGDPGSTKSEPAIAISDVLSQCSAALVEVAAAADGHAADALMMRDAWPK